MTIGIYELAAAGLLAALQITLMVQLARAQRAMSHTGKRLDQLTAALELLTDTSETGFGHVAAELERLGARVETVPAGAVREARVARPGRVARTAGSSPERRGDDRMTGASAAAVADDRGDLRSSDRPRPGELERWTTTMRRPPAPATGARHAAVRV